MLNVEGQKCGPVGTSSFRVLRSLFDTRFRLGRGSQGPLVHRRTAPGGSVLGVAARPRCGAIVLSLLLLCACADAALTVQVQPDPLMAGEAGQLRIGSDQAVPQNARLPQVAGIQWIAGPQISQQFQIVNLKKSFSGQAIYVFRALKPGKYTVPAFDVSLDGRVEQTPPVTFTVAAAQSPDTTGSAPSSDNLFFLRAAWLPAPDPEHRLYVGQQLLLELRVYVLEQVYRGAAYPEIRIDNAAFVENRDMNPQNPRFLPHQERREIVNGRPYHVIVFRCQLTPLAAGEVKGEAVAGVQLAAAQRQRRSRNDPFSVFDDDFFAAQQTVQRQVSVTVPALTVVPVPPPPADAGTFLGLVGDWQLDLKSSPAEVPVGEPVTMKLEIGGNGSIDALIPPALSLPEFRLYEPEVKKVRTAQGAQATVNLVAVPTSEKASLPPLAFCTFSPEKGTFTTARFTPALRVVPATGKPASGTAVVDSGKAPAGAEPVRRPTHDANDILYVKTTLGPVVLRPLWMNHLLLTTGLALSGLLAFMGLTLGALRRERLDGNRSYRRRRQALHDRKRILRELARAPADRRAGIIQEQLVPCLAAVFSLPPGTTAEALAERLAPRHPELATALRAAAQGEFRPGASQEIDVPAIVRAVRAFRVVLLAGLVATAAGSTAASAASAEAVAGTGPVSLEAATAAYDQGQVDAAAKVYAQLGAGGDRPAMLYNQGNCAFRLGNLGEAVLLFERARRLAPRDSDILENLNFVRAKLGLPAVGTTESPRQLLSKARDSLRPDEWSLLAAAGAGIAGIWAGVRRWRQRSPWPVLSLAGALAVICAVCMASQRLTTYLPERQGIVLRDGVTAFRLPDADAEKTPIVLHQGERVEVTERRAAWLRVRADQAEAWVPAGSVGVIWE